MTSQTPRGNNISEARSCYVNIQGRELHYLEWGAAGAEPLIMWHGLARTGRDFDPLAAA
jgi:hypothetical protein